MALVAAFRKYRDGLGKFRQRWLPVFLEKALAGDAFRHADHRQRAVGEVRQQIRRNLRQVAQQIALGQCRLLERFVGGPVHAVEMGQPDAVRAHRQHERLPRVVELPQHFVHPSVGRGCLHGALRFAAPHRFRIDILAQPQEHRRAQVAVRSPFRELHFGHRVGLEPDRGAVQRRRLGERMPLGFKRRKAFDQMGQRRVVEAAADQARIAQLAVFPVAEQQAPSGARAPLPRV